MADGIAVIQRELGKLIGLGEYGRKETGDERQQTDLLLIYNNSKSHIFKVADNIARGIINPGDTEKLLIKANDLTLPEHEEWGFNLGDTVKIGLSRMDFKWMQKKTLGWEAELCQFYGHVGIVSKVLSKYDNSVDVYFPDVFGTCPSLYPGVLVKVERKEGPKMARWKAGDRVEPIPSPQVLEIISSKMKPVPGALTKKQGRVVGVAPGCVIVTFDEKVTYLFKSSSLVRCTSTKAPPMKDLATSHSPNFQNGEKVKIISNMQRLILNQKGKGGWTPDMSQIRGEEATVIDIQENDTVNIQTRHSSSWRLSHNSVLRLGDKETEATSELKFIPGDIVKVMVSRNIRHTLTMAKIPVVFLEYLRASAYVSQVDDEFDCHIKFNQDLSVKAHIDTLRKAKPDEVENHNKIVEREKGLKVGDTVHLDVGPPNFVLSVVSTVYLEPLVKAALTKSATLVGFVDPFTAVIQYENGQRFRVKRKYLTVPEKFKALVSRETVDPETLTRLRDAIYKGVGDIHKRKGPPDEKWKVDISFMSRGNPPTVEFKIESTIADFHALLEWMNENSGWKIESLGEGQFIVVGADSEEAKMQVKVAIIFNDENSEVIFDHVFSRPDVMDYLERKFPQINTPSMQSAE